MQMLLNCSISAKFMLNPKLLLKVLPFVMLTIVQVVGISGVARSQPAIPQPTQKPTSAQATDDQKIGMVIAVAQSIQQPEPRANAFKAISAALVKNRQYDGQGFAALDLFSQARSLPNSLTKSDILSDIAIVARRQNNDALYRQAIQEIQVNPDITVQASVFTGTAIELLKIGDQQNGKPMLAQARSLIDRMSNTSPQILPKNQLLNLVAAAHIRWGNADTAKSLLIQSQQLINLQPEAEKSLLLIDLISMYIKLDDRETVSQLTPQAIKSIESISQKPAALVTSALYQKLARVLSPLNQETQQIELLQRTIDLSATASDVESNFLLPTLPRLASLQDQQKAEQMMLQMLRQVSIEKAGIAYSGFLEAFAQQATQFKDPQQAASLLEQSLKAAQNIKDPSQKSRILVVVAASYATIGSRSRTQISDYSRALPLLMQSQEIAQKAQKIDPYTYTQLAKGYLFIGDEAKAVQLLEQAISTSALSDHIGTIAPLDGIELLENPNQKRQLLSRMVATTPQLKTASDKIYQLLSAARIYDETGDRNTSQTLIQQALQQASQSAQKENYCIIARNDHYIKSSDWRSVIPVLENCDNFSKISSIRTMLDEYASPPNRLVGKDRIFASLSLTATIFTQYDLFSGLKGVSQVWED
jgi:tetratricopeptide (TPR) repeat protein